MIITNDERLILCLEMTDNKEPFRASECESLSIKVFTTDKNKFVKFNLDDVKIKEDCDEIEVSPLYLSALPSGVLCYQYTYKLDGSHYKKVNEKATDFYLKNTSSQDLPYDSEEGITAVGKGEFERFKNQTNETIEEINESITMLADISENKVNVEDNSVVYEYDSMIPINELYIDETENSEDEVYFKDEVDELIQDTKDYADEKVQELATTVDDEYAKKSDIPDVSRFLTQHQDLSQYQKTVDADGKYQPKGDYLTSHQDISNLATKEELEALTPNLSDYYTKSEAESIFLSEHQSLKSYLTEDEIDRFYASKTYVDEKVSEATDIDLTPYAGKAEVEAKLNDYVKKTYVDEKIKEIKPYNDSEIKQRIEVLEEIEVPEIPYIPTKVSDLEQDVPYLLKHQSLADYAKKSEIPTVPTKLSELINDEGFITQEINLNNYVERGYLHKKYFDKEDSDDRYLIREECVDKYYTKDDIDEMLVSQADLSSYALKSDLNALSDAFNAHDDDLSAYAKKDAVYTKSEVDKKVSDVDVTDKLNDYALKTDIPDVSQFLTQHQSLSNYYTKDQADVRFLTSHQSLEDYVKKGQLFGQFYTKEQIDAKKYLTEHQSLNGLATESWVESQGYIKEHQSLNGFATEEWVENQNYLTEHQSLDHLCKKEDTYDKTDVDALVNHIEGRFDNYYKKLETENLIRTFIQNVREPDLGAYLKIIDADNRYVVKDSLKPYLTCQEADKKFLTEENLNGYVTYKEGDKRYLNVHSLCDYWTAEETLEAILQARLPSVDGVDGLDLTIYLKKGEASKTYQPKGDYITREELDEEIAKIDTSIEITPITESEIRNLL